MLKKTAIVLISALLIPCLQAMPAIAQRMDEAPLSAEEKAQAEQDIQIYTQQRKKLGLALFYQFNERYKESFPILTELTQKGNPVASFYYAEALYNGWGTSQPNAAKAEEIFRQGIKRITAMKKRGDGLISYTIYYAYLKGHGKPQNIEKAMRWLDISIEQGYGLALFDKAKIQENTGHFQEAFATYLKSAEKENPEAQFRLGLIYEKGENGIKQNYPQALGYYSQAVKYDHTKAEANLANLYYNGLGTAKNHNEALRLFRKAAAKGNAAAINGLGVMTLKGEGGLPKNQKEAFNLFAKSASLGDANGLKNLGNMYYNGIGTAADQSKAFTFYYKAAMLKDADAMHKVAVMYDNGLGITKDKAKADYWYNKLEKEGYTANR